MLIRKQSRQAIVQEITTTYKVSAGAIDKWIRVARPLVEKRIKELEEVRVNQLDETFAEAVKEGLLSDIEIELILCKVISGGIEVEEWVKGKPILRGITPTEIINAAKAIYQKRGSNAPTKIAATNKDGEDIGPIKITLNLS